MNNQYSIGSEHWPGHGKGVEESGELLQVLGKLVGSHGKTKHWSGDLNQMLIDELGDVQAAINFFIQVNDLDAAAIEERRRAKESLFHRWHEETDGN